MEEIVNLINPNHTMFFEADTMIRFLLVVLVIDLIATVFSYALDFFRR